MWRLNQGRGGQLDAKVDDIVKAIAAVLPVPVPSPSLQTARPSRQVATTGRSASGTWRAWSPPREANHWNMQPRTHKKLPNVTVATWLNDTRGASLAYAKRAAVHVRGAQTGGQGARTGSKPSANAQPTRAPRGLSQRVDAVPGHRQQSHGALMVGSSVVWGLAERNYSLAFPALPFGLRIHHPLS
jgi:hypothetical protein